MRIGFLGTSDFAVSAVKALVENGQQVVAVVTQPASRKGRGLKILPQPVDEAASKYGLNAISFKDINSADAVRFLKESNADIFVVVAFGQILSKEILEIPKFYSVNLHASLLPKYRGAAPIQWALINGDKETGVTVIRMNEFLDSGDIIAQGRVTIKEDENTLSLNKRLSCVGAELLVESLGRIEKNRVNLIPQDESKASYAPKLKKEDGLIDWRRSAADIKNLIRGCYPWPSAYTYFHKRLLKILEAGAVPGKREGPAGAVLENGREPLLVACGNGALLIKRLQMEGKRPLDAGEFLRGHPIPKGEILG